MKKQDNFPLLKLINRIRGQMESERKIKEEIKPRDIKENRGTWKRKQAKKPGKYSW